jgi:hypothetical protein
MLSINNSRTKQITGNAPFHNCGFTSPLQFYTIFHQHTSSIRCYAKKKLIVLFRVTSCPPNQRRLHLLPPTTHPAVESAIVAAAFTAELASVLLTYNRRFFGWRAQAAASTLDQGIQGHSGTRCKWTCSAAACAEVLAAGADSQVAKPGLTAQPQTQSWGGG